MAEDDDERRGAFCSRLTELGADDADYPWANAPGLAMAENLGRMSKRWPIQIANGYNNGLLVYLFTNFGNKKSVFGVLFSLGQQSAPPAGYSPNKFKDSLQQVIESREVKSMATKILGCTPEYVPDSNDRGRRWMEFCRTSSDNLDAWRLNGDTAYELLKRLRQLWDQLLWEAAESIASGNEPQEVIETLVQRPIRANPPIYEFEQQLRTSVRG
jgi:hypothetical protein